MRSREYGTDVIGDARRQVRDRVAAAKAVDVVVEPGLVVEDRETGFCGAVLEIDAYGVTLEDRAGRRRVFPPLAGGFLYEGRPATLVRPRAAAPTRPTRTASGSVAVHGAAARVARGSRIWVEGIHDAALVERVWGDDLRVEGVVVEPLDGLDGLPDALTAFRPGPGRRVGVLADHLVDGTKESRIAAAVRSPHVMIAGHPYVDVWEAVKPAALGIPGWPQVPRGQSWKDGVCRALGFPDPQTAWRLILGSVHGWGDLEVSLLRAVESLIDFVTAPEG